MHKIFDPHEEDAQMLLQELRSDPIYVRMCKTKIVFVPELALSHGG